MARIAGVNIPTNKRVHISLRYIHGIGPMNAVEICKKVGIEESKRVNQLSEARSSRSAKSSTASSSSKATSAAKSQ